METESKKKWNIEDYWNFILLSFLYVLQGSIFGIITGTIPFLVMEKYVNISDGNKDLLGLLSLSQYPYSLKIIWSPIIDFFYLPWMGRRKTWIIPMQITIGFMMIVMSFMLPEVLKNVEKITELGYIFIFYCIVMMFLCSIQDIATDGWALTILSKDKMIYGSSAQSIGISIGYFISFTILLIVSSEKICRQFKLLSIKERCVITVQGYMYYYGFIFIIFSLFLLFKKEEEEYKKNKEGMWKRIKEGYIRLYKIFRNKNIKKLMCILLIYKLGFVANDTLLPLKLLECGYEKEEIATTVLIDFPIQLIIGIYSSHLGKRKFKFLEKLIILKLGVTSLTILTVYFLERKVKMISIFMRRIILVLITVINSSTYTMIFVVVGCFFIRISDPKMGGIYMTLLQTASNMGGVWPKYFIIKLQEKTLDSIICYHWNESQTSIKEVYRYIGYIICADRYYIVTIFCLCIGYGLLIFYINPKLEELDEAKKEEWRIVDEEVQE